MAVTRDKEYDLTKGGSNSKVHYFTANPNGEAEVVTVYLTSGSKARKKVFDFDFAELEIKGRGAGGNILTRYPVRKIQLKEVGKSTLGGLDMWYDDSVGRLNRDGRGHLLGKFNSEDLVLAIYRDGSYKLTNFELTNRYEHDKIEHICKFNPKKPVVVVYYDGDSKTDYVKRFLVETTTQNKQFPFINESRSSKVHFATTEEGASVEVTYKISGKRQKKEVILDELIDVKGWKAIGNKFPYQKPVAIKPIADTSSENEDEDVGNKKTTTVDEGPEKAPQQQELNESKNSIDQPANKDKTTSDSFEVGSTIELDVSSDDEEDQLGLF